MDTVLVRVISTNNKIEQKTTLIRIGNRKREKIHSCRTKANQNLEKCN